MFLSLCSCQAPSSRDSSFVQKRSLCFTEELRRNVHKGNVAFVASKIPVLACVKDDEDSYSRREVIRFFAAALTVTTLQPHYVASAASLTKGDDGYSTVEDEVSEGKIVFRIPSTWKIKDTFPPQPNAILAYYDGKDKDLVAVGTDVLRQKDGSAISSWSEVNLNAPATLKVLRSIGQRILVPPINESDEPVGISILESSIVDIDGVSYLKLKVKFSSELYTDAGRSYFSVRIGYASVAIKNGKAYSVTASAIDSNFSKISATLKDIVDSYRFV